MRLQYRCVGCKVRGGSGVRLDVDAPQIWVQAEDRECSLLTQQLNLVYDLCTSIVPEKDKRQWLRFESIILWHIVLYQIVLYYFVFIILYHQIVSYHIILYHTVSHHCIGLVCIVSYNSVLCCTVPYSIMCHIDSSLVIKIANPLISNPLHWHFVN